MNTLDSIIKLIDAGFTKSEIDKLINSPSVENSADDQPAPDPEPAPTAADPAQAPEPAKENPSTQDAILEYLKQMNANIVRSNLNQTFARAEERTPEDILAEIIAPPNLKKK